VIVFFVLMIYKGPSEVVTLVGGVLRAVDALAGDLVKALQSAEHCSRTCQPAKPG
jgi:hypothetical protein